VIDRTDLTVKIVTPKQVNAVWPKVEHFISTAQPWGLGDHSMADIKACVDNGRWALLIATDKEDTVTGVATVTFIPYPGDRVGFITYIAGHLVSSKDANEQFRTLLKQLGANRVQGYVRKSMARYAERFGWQERGIVVETTL